MFFPYEAVRCAEGNSMVHMQYDTTGVISIPKLKATLEVCKRPSFIHVFFVCC